LKNETWRCCSKICEFADKLFPEYTASISKNNLPVEHGGVYYIIESDLESYANKVNPIFLKYDKRTNTRGFIAKNIGVVKGREFDHVLIFPTQKMATYLKTGNLDDVGYKEKLYVAVTRAKYSVAFVLKNGEVSQIIKKWNPTPSDFNRL
jgi:DNA helicase II / ATP-dependent DNA helicase PcrA